jgi:hypothetical protein
MSARPAMAMSKTMGWTRQVGCIEFDDATFD